MSRAKLLFLDFLADRRGNIALTFGLVSTSLVLLAGGSLDMMTYMSDRNYLQDKVDATALHIGLNLTAANQGTATQRAKDYMEKIWEAKHGTLKSVAVTPSEGSLVLTASADVDTHFLGMIGKEVLTTTASSTVNWGDNSLEVALVFDTTGSMLDNNKFPSAKTAAKSLVTTLASKATASSTVKFALVPFANFVNVGSGYQNANWIDNNATSPYHSAYFSSGRNRFSLYANLGKSWPGCVETRPSPYDIDDTAPVTSNPSTLFVPSFHPDEPNTSRNRWGQVIYEYANSYMNDDTSSTDEITKMTNASKYTTRSGVSYSNSTFYSNYQVPKGPGFLCSTDPLKLLTADGESIKTAITNLTAAGSTNIPEGVAWGWRVLSPKGPFATGADYSTKTLKVLVLLTDGTNSINTLSTPLGGAYSSWGYPYSGRLGSNPGTNLRNGLDAKTRSVCTAIKAKGIKIYTIGLMIDDSAGQQMLADCSSGSDYYYNSPSASQLDTIFASIAQKITKLRIAK